MDLRAIVEAATLDVAVAGSRVALHCHTQQGRVVVQLSLEEFCAKARAARDCNGRPIVAPTPKAAVLAADAAAVPVTVHSPERVREGDAYKPSGRKRGSYGTRTALCSAAWADLQANPLQRVQDVAARHGVLPKTLANWISYQHGSRALTLLRGGRRPERRAA